MSAKEMKRKARAFVLIETDPGTEKEVMEKLLKLEEVKEAHIYSGEMDLVIVLETDRDMLVPSSKKITDFVIEKVQSIPEIQDTETLVPSHSKTKWPERA